MGYKFISTGIYDNLGAERAAMLSRLTNAELRERERLMSVDITLDGVPAHIVGRLLPFPHVRQYEGAHEDQKSVEFCWDTVQHVIDTQGGEFHS